MDEPPPGNINLPAKISSGPLPAPAGVRVKVLLVEDNDSSRDMIKMLLELEGAEVLVASDGREGLDAILRERPQLALVDIGLPKLDGFQVARTVRESLSPDEVRLVAMTGYGEADDRRAVVEAGFDEHLVKPVPIDEFYRVLREARSPRPLRERPRG